jgi:hypothetical protein
MDWFSTWEPLPHPYPVPYMELERVDPPADGGLFTTWLVLAVIVLAAAVVWYRQKRLELTQHTVRCPLEDRTASLTVRSDPGGYPSRRHLGVTACSLLSSTPFVPPARSAYFSDVAPAVPYVCEVDAAPRHWFEASCSKRCLAVLNAAESGAAEPVRCTSGVSDSLELVRQTQSLAITRLLWFYGA